MAIVQHISSSTNTRVKHWVKLSTDRSYRTQQGTVLITGRTLVDEVCSQTSARALIVQEGVAPPKALREPAEHFVVTDTVFKKIAPVQHPDGIAAEIAIPLASDLQQKKRIVVFDEISDPGNLGTLLRTALALGWDGVFIVNTSVDPYNDKAIRAARGATFRLPMAMGSWEKLDQLIEASQMQKCVADTCGQDPREVHNEQPIALILSNEARGPSAGALDHATKITIPMPGEMESLNVSVAGGILMYLLADNK